MAEGGKNVEIQEDGRKRNRGAPSLRQKQILNMMTARSPEAVAPRLFPRAGAPYDLIEEVSAADKFTAISKIISGGLENAAKDAATRSGDLAPLRPWPSQAAPQNRLSTVEAEFAMNEAVINALTAHLVEHLIIREDLRQQAEQARRQAAEESRRIPEFMEDFGSRLIAAGVIKGDIRFMTEDRLERIVEVIKGLAERPAVEATEPVPTAQATPIAAPATAGEPNLPAAPIMGIVPVESAFSGEGAEAGQTTVGEPAEPEVETAPGEAALEIEDGASDEPIAAGAGENIGANTGLDRVKIESETAVPEKQKGRWDELDLKSLPYEIFERPAVSDEDAQALKMQLPDVDSVSQLALQSGPELNMANSVEDYADFVLAKSLLNVWSVRVSKRLSDQEISAWMFLLVAVRHPDKARKSDTDLQFAGLVLPGPTGSSKVREIRLKTA